MTSGLSRTLAVCIVIVTTHKCFADAELPPLFLVAQSNLVGFITPSGDLKVPPKYVGRSGGATEGFIWVVSEVEGRLRGNFLRPDGRELLDVWADVYWDDQGGSTPEFYHGRAVVAGESNTWLAVTRVGVVGLTLWQKRDFRIVPYRESGRYGFSNETGEQVIPPRFESALPFEGDVAPVMLDGLWGLIDQNGRMKCDAKYDSVTWGRGGWLTKSGALSGWMRADGSKLMDPTYESIWCVGEAPYQHLAFRRGGKFGVVDANDGRVLIPPEYAAVYAGGAQGIWLGMKVEPAEPELSSYDGLRRGMVDYEGNILQPFIYDQVNGPQPLRPICGQRLGLWYVMKNGNLGVIDCAGNMLLPCNYSTVSLSENQQYLSVEKYFQVKGLFSIPDRKFVIEPAQYVHLVYSPRHITNMALTLDVSGTWRAIQLTDGHEVFSFGGRQLSFWHGLIMAQSNNLCALFDVSGRTILDWAVGATSLPNDGGYPDAKLARLECKGKVGLIDTAGKIVMPCRFEDLGVISEGLVSACVTGRWGYVDLQGNWVVDPLNEAAHPFSHGLAGVMRGGKCGCIDTNGLVRIPFRYKNIGSAYNDRIPVSDVVDGVEKWGLIDTKGGTVLPLVYDAIEWIDVGAPLRGDHSVPTRYYGRKTWSWQ